MKIKDVKLVIFDIAGTIVDYGCLSVKDSFLELFSNHNLYINSNIITQYTGVSKLTHLKCIIEDPKAFVIKDYVDECSNIIDFYDEFNKILNSHIVKNDLLISGALELYEYFDKNKIKVILTTGYNYFQAKDLAKSIRKQGLKYDYILYDDDVKRGRPYPYIIFDSMMNSNIESVHSVISIGDTPVDMQTGFNAGVKTLGIVESSALIGLCEKKLKELDLDKYDILTSKTAILLDNAGASDICYSLSDVIERIEQL